MRTVKCGSCREIGHNKNYCPSSSSTITDYKNIGDKFLIIPFDLETTGLSPYRHEIIQIASKTLIFSNGEIKGTTEYFDKFVCPVTPIPALITHITGISDDDVKESKCVKEVFSEWTVWLESQCKKFECDKIVLAAHNSDFDMKFIFNSCSWRDEPSAEKFSKYVVAVINTVPICKSLELKCTKYKLGHIYKELFKKDIENAHNALYDVDALCEIIKHQTFIDNLLNEKFTIAVKLKDTIDRMEKYRLAKFAK